MAHATTMTHAPAFATGSYSSTPLGLGSSAPLMPSIAPKKGASGLRRKHTMAKFGKGKGGKARGDVTTNALLEVALAAVLNNANVVAENVSNEVSCGCTRVAVLGAAVSPRVGGEDGGRLRGMVKQYHTAHTACDTHHNPTKQVVFQATMQVPMHHVMACRIEVRAAVSIVVCAPPPPPPPPRAPQPHPKTQH